MLEQAVADGGQDSGGGKAEAEGTYTEMKALAAKMVESNAKLAQSNLERRGAVATAVGDVRISRESAAARGEGLAGKERLAAEVAGRWSSAELCAALDAKAKAARAAADGVAERVREGESTTAAGTDALKAFVEAQAAALRPLLTKEVLQQGLPLT